jgi:NTE family protein
MIITIFALYGCATISPSVHTPNKEPANTRLKKAKPRVVLVLGSGSARGFAHAGVLKVLEENNIPIDMIVGTSAGSIVGSLYADHPSATWLTQLLLKTKREEVIDFSLMNISQGIITGSQLQKFLTQNLRARTFEELTIPFIAVATDLETGKAHAFMGGPIVPAVNASSAAPPFFQPIQLYGRTYVDGGLVDPIAVDIAKQYQPKIIIAVSLNYPLSKDIPSNSPGVFLKGVEMMLMRLNYYSAAEAQVVITPQPEDIGMFDGSKRSEIVKAGENATRKALPAIKKLLAEHHIALKNA